MRADNCLRGKRRISPPFLEVKPNGPGLGKLAGLARLWGRSYLYQAHSADRVILAADELQGLDSDLLAVVGPMTQRELKEFFATEVGTET
jgi:hypothetical protein